MEREKSLDVSECMCKEWESDIFMIPFPRHPYICSSERARALNLSLYAGKPAGGGWSPSAPCGQVHWEFMTPHSLQRSLKLAFAIGETTPWKWHVMGQENKRNERETRWHSWKPMTVEQEELDLQCIMESNNSKYTQNSLFSKGGGCLGRGCSVLFQLPQGTFLSAGMGALQLAMNGRTC